MKTTRFAPKAFYEVAQHRWTLENVMVSGSLLHSKVVKSQPVHPDATGQLPVQLEVLFDADILEVKLGIAHLPRDIYHVKIQAFDDQGGLLVPESKGRMDNMGKLTGTFITLTRDTTISLQIFKKLDIHPIIDRLQTYELTKCVNDEVLLTVKIPCKIVLEEGHWTEFVRVPLLGDEYCKIEMWVFLHELHGLLSFPSHIQVMGGLSIRSDIHYQYKIAKGFKTHIRLCKVSLTDTTIRVLKNRKDVLMSIAAAVVAFKVATNPVERELEEAYYQVAASSRQTGAQVQLVLEGTELPISQFLITSLSPVFRAMFRSGMKEQQTGKVHLANIDLRECQLMVEFLHTGKADLNDTDFLLRLADRFDIKMLLQHCEKMIDAYCEHTNIAAIEALTNYVHNAIIRASIRKYYDRRHKNQLSAIPVKPTFSMTNYFATLYEEKFMSDVTVVVQNTDAFQCHSLIIKARAPQLFDRIESTPNGLRLRIRNFSVAIVEDILHFIYTSKLRLLELHYDRIEKFATYYKFARLAREVNHFKNMTFQYVKPEPEMEPQICSWDIYVEN